MSQYEPANPYSAPAGSTAYSGNPVRSPIPMIFGILNLLFGVLGICGIIAFGIVMMIPELNKQSEDMPFQAIPTEGPLRYIQMVSVGIGAILTFVLIASGIGLWRYRRWGRTLSIVYGALALLSTIVTTGLNFYVTWSQPPPANAEIDVETLRLIMVASMLVSGCASLIYPVVLLIVMQLDRVKRSLT